MGEQKMVDVTVYYTDKVENEVVQSLDRELPEIVREAISSQLERSVPTEICVDMHQHPTPFSDIEINVDRVGPDYSETECKLLTSAIGSEVKKIAEGYCVAIYVPPTKLQFGCKDEIGESQWNQTGEQGPASSR
jgi:hypothetical protein